MKTVYRFISISFIFLFTFILFPVSNVLAATSEEIYQNVQKDIDVANSFMDKINAAGDDNILQVVDQEAQDLEIHFFSSAQFYSNAASIEQDEELKTILKKLESSVQGLSSSLDRLELAIEAQDVDEYKTASLEYDQNIDAMNSAITELDSHFGVTDYEPILSVLFWISLLISLWLLILAKGKETLPAEKLRNEFEFALFKASLWPFFGTSASYIWYLLTPAGGTFYMLWGIIAIGHIQFIRGLFTYITEARPAIEKAKKQQQSKLDELLSSEEFKNASYKEKIEEISNRKPIVDLSTHKEKCPKCHTANSKDANFCKKCGHKLE